MVDNCFCTSVLQQPINLVDIVIHSATKYLDGQGRCLGGVLVGAKTLIDPIRSFIRAAGPTLSPLMLGCFEGIRDLGFTNETALGKCTKYCKMVEQSDKAGKALPD